MKNLETPVKTGRVGRYAFSVSLCYGGLLKRSLTANMVGDTNKGHAPTFRIWPC